MDGLPKETRDNFSEEVALTVRFEVIRIYQVKRKEW
jgi:hypothetical protein